MTSVLGTNIEFVSFNIEEGIMVEKYNGGSFNAGSDEYSLTEGSPDLYGDRYRNLVKWEQKVHEVVKEIISEYKKAWKND